MDEPRVEPRLWLTLVLLCLIYILSFIDRFMLALLAAPLRADLGLTDLQLGLLFGTFFAIFYGILGIPLARLADRGNRKRVIVAGILIWSACTVGSAFANDYATLALLRIGLAVGEAALTPAALSILTDAFPERRKLLAGTIYNASGMFGGSAFFLIGAGVIAVSETLADGSGWTAWRIAFIAVGIPGFLLAALFAVIAREPSQAERGPTFSLGAVMRYLRGHARFYGGLFVGAGASQMLSYSMIAWSPALLQRSFGIDVKQTGVILGVTNILATVGGALIVPILIRSVAARSIPWGARSPALAAITGIAIVVLAVLSSSLPIFLVLSTIGIFLVTGSTNALLVMIQPVPPAGMRATITALLLICISSLGLGIGPPLVALLADRSGSGIGTGLALLGLADMLAAGTALALAARPMRDLLFAKRVIPL